MSGHRVVPSSSLYEDIDSVSELEQEDGMRVALIPPSVTYLKDLVPKSTASNNPPTNIEYIPKDRVSEFSSGYVSGADSNRSSSITRKQTEFIPAEFAKSFVRRMEHEMRELDSKYRNLLREMDKAYAEMEEESQRRYVGFIEKMTGEMEAQKGVQQAIIDNLRDSFRTYKSETEHQVAEYKRKLVDLRVEKNELAQNLVNELDRNKAEKENLFVRDKETREREMQQIEENCKLEQEKQRKTLENTINSLQLTCKTQENDLSVLQTEITQLNSMLKQHFHCEYDISELLVRLWIVDMALKEAESRAEITVGQIILRISVLRQALGGEALTETEETAIVAEMERLQAESAALGFPLETTAQISTQKQLSAALSTIESLQNEVKSLKSAIVSGSDTVTKQVYSERIATLTAELDHFRSLFSPSNPSEDPLLSATQAKLAIMTAERNEAQTENRELRVRIAELEKIIENAPKSQPEDLEAIAKLKKQIELMKKKHKTYRNLRESEFNKELETRRKQCDDTDRENHRLHEEIRTLTRQITEEKEYYRQVLADLDSLTKLKAEHTQLSKEIADLQKSNVQKESELKESIRQRKLLHNQLEDMKGKIRVYCRARPMSTTELSKQTTNVLTIPDEFTINCEMRNGTKTFAYDSVFGPGSSQEEVFEETKGLVQSAVDGYNVCVFAYGQTGSGKTYTMQGTKANPGVTPRVFIELFQILNRLPDHYRWKVSCYMVELYLDTLIDLLLPADAPNGPLTIKNDINGMVEIPEVTILPASSPHDLHALFDRGESKRHTSYTKMNDTSSRSHLIFSMFVEVEKLETSQRTVGKMSLVDLAGSERVSKTDSTADRLREGRAINKSLTALGDVIAALSGGDSHIPYRNNKLTMLMSDSLGGTVSQI